MMSRNAMHTYIVMKMSDEQVRDESMWDIHLLRPKQVTQLELSEDFDQELHRDGENEWH